MLVQAAAKEWGISLESLSTEAGHVVSPEGRKLSYGALAGAAARLPVPENPPLKNPKDFQIIGRPTSGIDVPDIVKGKAMYGMDVKVPGVCSRRA
jgi:isoquinoline 1-oxidoreductase beta subunit